MIGARQFSIRQEGGYVLASITGSTLEKAPARDAPAVSRRTFQLQSSGRCQSTGSKSGILKVLSFRASCGP
jgi:hypothetical protein